MANLLGRGTLTAASAALLVAHLLAPALLRRMPLAATSNSVYAGCNGVTPDAANEASKGRLVEALDKLPLRFEENQVAGGTGFKFVARGVGVDFGIKPTEIVTRLHTAEQGAASPSPAVAPCARAEHIPDENSKASAPKPRHKTALLRMRLVGANRSARVICESELATRSNYFANLRGRQISDQSCKLPNAVHYNPGRRIQKSGWGSSLASN